MKKKRVQVEDVNQNIRDEDEAALAEHLKSVHSLSSIEDFNMNYTFSVLLTSDPKELESLEWKCISDVKTLTPFGLNIVKPFGIGENLI